MDPETKSKDTVVKVTGWLRGIWEMRRQNGPVQQWIDSIPSPIKSSFSIKNDHQRELTEKPSISLVQTEPKDIPYSKGTNQPSMTVSAPINVPNTTAVNTTGLPSSLPHKLMRDPSLQSDSSHCSSVESLLELRKADPEAILLGLGFGGCPSSPQENGSFSRIPKRFLQPSKLKGIAINDFMKQQQETSESFDSVSLGYRGLTGSPYVAPSEIVQKIVQRLREHESHEHDPYATYNSYEQYSPLQCNGTLSVLSPDNRQFLEQPRSKSPDMRNKRMIIGQKSFAFGHDGDLIEIDPSDVNRSPRDDSNNESNAIKNSETSEDVTNNDTDFSKIMNTEKILPKRLSFEDSAEFDNVDSALETHKENSDMQNLNLDKNTNYKKDESLDKTSYDLSDIRRASSGSCEAKMNTISSTAQRRHSDGFVQTTENTNETNLTRKRRTLKRQTRISDMDMINYCESKPCISDTAQYTELECKLNKKDDACARDKNISTKSMQNINETANVKSQDEHHIVKCSSRTLSENRNNCILPDSSTSSSSSSLIKIDQQPGNSECNVSEKSLSIHTEGETTCCCRSGTKKYWKKMEKIIQEKKNLETVVAKNRREMREIREMLSSVLSVRLEPGF